MIITPHRCVNFIAENFAENLNKTCKLKGKCQLISDKASCSAFVYSEIKGKCKNGKNN